MTATVDVFLHCCNARDCLRKHKSEQVKAIAATAKAKAKGKAKPQVGKKRGADTSSMDLRSMMVTKS